MSLVMRSARSTTLASVGVAPRGSGKQAQVSPNEARRNSAVWACRRLRGDLISSMPVDVYRKVDGVNVEVPKPPVLLTPGGKTWKTQPWLYASQGSLDEVGNSVGLITVRDGLGLPSVIELVDMTKVSLIVRDGQVHHWKINGQKYDPADVWHERQYELAGFHLGLSPIAHAAYALSKYSSAEEFAREWFDGQAIPAAALKNVDKVVPRDKALEIKDQYHASVANGGLFVHGKDWEYKPIQAATSDAAFLESMNADLVSICRFMGCPADVIDAMVSGQSVTYANITQRNLQLLVHNLTGPVKRREDALSDLTPKPRFVKLNSDALLRMDPESRARMVVGQVEGRILAPSEARAIEDRLPFTPEQISEFHILFGDPNKKTPATTTGAA